MAISLFNKRTGKYVTLLNPAEKGRKYAVEMKAGIHVTNDEKVKKRKGKAIRLTDTQKAYRAGYLASRSDSAKCYNAQDCKRKTKIKTSSKYGKSKLRMGSLKYI